MQIGMTDSIQLLILSPERALVRETVESVEFPGSLGRFEVLKNHAPLISSLERGDIVYRIDGERDGRVSISSGFVEICQNRITACVEL